MLAHSNIPVEEFMIKDVDIDKKGNYLRTYVVDGTNKGTKDQ
jgi:hypothetical protein